MLIYVSGRYSGDVDKNIEEARDVAIACWRIGHAVICPHLNTAHFEVEAPDISYDDYISGDLSMIARCDAMVMVPGWQDSKGAVIEKDYAASLGIPVYEAPYLPPLHPVEVRCPEQAKGFREIVGRMYRLHLDKNADYSPANITLTDEIGVATRIWDKVARLLSLTGFKFQALLYEGFEAPKNPQNEPIVDTYLDLANYGVIGLLLHTKRWGK